MLGLGMKQYTLPVLQGVARHSADQVGLVSSLSCRAHGLHLTRSDCMQMRQLLGRQQD